MFKIVQPVNQIRLTNVAVVRLRQGGQRFEIACYPNKVRDWRNGLEKDVMEVLQSHRIFTNVSKGEFAKDSDLQLCFGTSDLNQVSAKILDRGDVQMSAKERTAIRDAFVKEVCGLAAERLFSFQTGLPLTPAMVENAAKQYRILPKYKEGLTSKAACATLMTRLVNKLPQEIGRAMLRADVICDAMKHKDLSEQLVQQFNAQVLGDEIEGGKRKLSFRAPTAEYQALLEFVPSVGAELQVVKMLDATEPPAKKAVEASPKETAATTDSPDGQVDGSDHESSVESSSEEESSESGDDGEEEDDDDDRRRKTNFAALMSSDESEEDEESVLVSIRSTDDLKSVRTPNLEGLEEELRDALTSIKSSETKGRMKKVNLDADNWSRKQQKKKQERREKEKERKQAERENLVRQKIKAEQEEKRQEAERRQNALPEIILDGGPGWCVDCQVNYVTELQQDVRQHFRMEWHTFNSKRRLRGKAPVTRQEFDELSRDIKEGFLAVTF
eukprot:Blabericola_migrator_1__4073@NODE_223_length_11158_cov_141_106032_g189_i0_p4_GENE_NODE_223_length_11158_cov_141_106032_g189_i0NODE_223_length_11158_cov_141_106032_g189_i0_p4_ORF_typecomplete_len500_score129_32SBDS/PF01172_18/4_5e31SBDS_C/PF09377_10/3_9e07Macoilin/PF09726_9/0_03SR25/PF10500_9/0_51DUF2956/PF11169_8/4_6e03DUF2956/PF11169_8/0_12PGA2/PF07543_12/1_5e02PGA2/PF07543_12/0_22EMC3_TMCO1/PF01956_16/4_9RNA_pol_Rpc4/PF05132_14/96RNA_pol_Rpc4/PF05132_14/2_4_NODE_223_length_11158_cov_141_106032